MERRSRGTSGIDRRRLLRGAGAALGGVVLAPWAAALGCRRGAAPAAVAVRPTPTPAPATGPLREHRLAVQEAEVDLGGRIWRTWTYDGRYPGPELRLAEGERLRVTVANRLPHGTTIHWHGVPVPNPMDGVPGVTQEEIGSGAEFAYEFTATPAGSYLYHSHVGLQLDRGLLGPLVIEEASPHVPYDREYTLLLDDWLPGEPEPLEGPRMGPGMMGRGGGMRGMMVQVPPYQATVINGRLPTDPPTVEVRRGERVRLRLMNPASATTFRVAVAGHRMTVTHTDGRPVRPVTVDALLISMGERYDVVVEADNPGAWNIVAAPVLEVDAPAARAVLRYRDAAAVQPPSGQRPEGIAGGRLLRLEELEGTEPPAWAGRRPDRTFDLPLSGGMPMAPRWQIGGQSWPDAEPLEIAEGELIRVNMVNHSAMLHPMHLHGHFFRVGDCSKETVMVPAHMGRVTFDFLADNPGDWFFHCHNLYHLVDGMARVFRYV